MIYNFSHVPRSPAAKIVAAFVCALAGFCAAYYGSSHSGKATLRMGSSIFPPYIQPRVSGAPGGLAAALVTRAADLADIRIEWVDIGLQPADEALAKNVIDAYPLLTVTDERLRRFHMSEPWWENDMALISLDRRKIATGRRGCG